MAELQDKRTRILEPPRRFSPMRLGELWHYRELLYILAWRDVKVRYKQALLGAAWAVVQPLVMMGIFTLLFSRIANVPTGFYGTPPKPIPYPVFAFVALVPWTMFASATAGSGASLVSNQNLVSKVYFPRLAIPAGAVVTWVPDFAIGSAILFVIMAIFGFVPPLTAVLLPFVMLAAMLASFSVGVWLSALNVAYRDVQYVVPFLIQVWLFITPVAYPTSSVPEHFRWITGLNPMLWVIDLSRWALLGTTASWGVVGISIATMIVLLVGGLYYFRRVEHFFADVI